MDIPRVALNTGTESHDRTFEEYMRSEPTTSQESVGAAFDLAIPDTATGLLIRATAEWDNGASGVKPLTPEEANSRYPGMRTPFRESVNPYTAQLLYDREQETITLQDKIARGPQDSWTRAKQFGAGIFAHLMDPLELAGGQIVGAGLGAMAVRGAFGARAASTTAALRAGAPLSTSARVGAATAEGLASAGIENAVQEIAQQAVEAKEGFDSGRDMGDIFTDWAVGTIAGGALQGGISYGAGKLVHMLQSTSPEAGDAVLRNIVQATETNLIPDSRPLMKALAQETSVLPQDFGHTEYKFEPVTAETVRTRKFYASTVDANPDLKLGSRADLGDGYGFGIHLSDNPGVANAASARSMADSQGLVHEVELTGDIRPLPIAATAAGDPELAKGLSKIIADFAEDADRVVADMPIKDILGGIRDLVDEGHLPPQTIADVEALIKSRGYNALIDDGSSRLGEVHAQHNHLTILDESLVEGRAAREPDARVVRQPRTSEVDAEAARVQDPNSQFFVDTDEHARNLETIDAFNAESGGDIAKITRELDEAIEELNTLRDQGFYSDAEVDSFVKELKETRRLAQDEHDALKAYKACAGM